MPTLEEFRELCTAKLDAFNRRDWQAIVYDFPPHFEWHFLEGVIDRLPTRTAGLPAVFDDLVSQFPDWHVEPFEMVEPVTNTFVVRLVARGSGAASGAPIKLDFAQVWDFDGDLAVLCREFASFSEALAKARQ